MGGRTFISGFLKTKGRPPSKGDGPLFSFKTSLPPQSQAISSKPSRNSRNYFCRGMAMPCPATPVRLRLGILSSGSGHGNAMPLQTKKLSNNFLGFLDKSYNTPGRLATTRCVRNFKNSRWWRRSSGTCSRRRFGPSWSHIRGMGARRVGL